MNKAFFGGKKVLVMGLGRFGGGVDVSKFAANAGAKVIVTDLLTKQKLSGSISQLDEFPDIEFHLGSHCALDFEQTDIIIVNPAVAPDNEYLQLARQHKKSIMSQIGIFFELCPARIIGITGANGKSTTAALTAHLLKKARYEIRDTRYENVWLSGNIGNQPLLTLLDKISPDDLVVLELSSFQIEQLAEIKKAPHIVLLTNLTPNHLDRYGTFENYCTAKENVFKFQKCDVKSPAVSIFNAEDEIASQWFGKYSEQAGRVCIKFLISEISKKIQSNFGLPGRANLSNLAAAIAIAKYLGIDEDCIKDALVDFRALSHRLEFIAEINGVRWYNDSKATTPHSAIAALDAFEQPRIIVAGGYDKNITFEELGRKIAQSAKAAILLGQTAQKIAKAIKTCLRSRVKIEIVPSLAEAVESAHRLSESGDVVLLSPACASYDMFDNYQQRGDEFVGLVRNIMTL